MHLSQWGIASLPQCCCRVTFSVHVRPIRGSVHGRPSARGHEGKRLVSRDCTGDPGRPHAIEEYPMRVSTRFAWEKVSLTSKHNSYSPRMHMNAQKSTRVRTFRRTLLAAACVAASAPVFAQSAAAPAAGASAPDQLQRVEITGSRIKQIDVETASPVQVITREAIRKTN